MNKVKAEKNLGDEKSRSPRPALVTDLLPCPFCGKKPDGGVWSGSTGMMWHTGACKLAGIGFTKKEWNTRA